MDLLRTDDQMDLASSPAMQTEDVELDLDDVREASAEPNQDLMLQDEPEQPTADSDLMRSTVSDHADDDLMLDEDTVIPQPDRTEIPELNMQNQEYEHAQVDQDDDILYEDEEELQEDGGLPGTSFEEQQMQDEHQLEDQQLIQEVQIDEDIDDEIKPEGDLSFISGASAQEGEEINDSSEPLQAGTAATAGNSAEGVETSRDVATNLLLEQQSDAKPLGKVSENVDLDRNADEKPDKADFDNGPDDNLESSDHATQGQNAAVDGLKVIKKLLALQESDHDPGASPQINANSAQEDIANEPNLPTSMLPTVKVHYLGTEVSLFAPTRSELAAEYFLEDVKLAHESLDKMLGACRQVLSGSIGEDEVSRGPHCSMLQG